ncbi:phosphoadenosine phosphosulfate reductase domain-containing protein [Hymenobacter glacieicola]|uniref:phosphoadenosine phosphosulfate reductase domain-containing protein n=1 Tax=Hymenobacter glacieicola TaxID=1562124 RepID=UPI001E353E4C|nr:phosphoadenosine phosphosulfate reductase family protein [Hymenobacter glacieicola]
MSRRLNMRDSIEMTANSLNAYGELHKHWSVAWSGGKDSTATLTVLIWMLDAGLVKRPETLTVLFADTRMELTPLMAAAQDIISDLRERGIEVRTVMAPLDKRFLVYILGRGIPPPNNNTLRWCTRQIKVDPMTAELRSLYAERGEKILTITGVRQGESAVRDKRILMSCGKNGAECGQGWYQETLPGNLTDTLAPLLHWRVCHVWEWLRTWAPKSKFGDWSTKLLAEAYGGDEAEEVNARTGCMGCPLASKDTALENIVTRPGWEYLKPLLGLKPIYRWLREPSQRIRKAGLEKLKSGKNSKNPQRMGPITLEARLEALERILAIQAEVNRGADAAGRKRVDILNAEEEARIRELIALNTWPQRWTGEEPLATEVLPTVYADGTVQPLLFHADDGYLS